MFHVAMGMVLLPSGRERDLGMAVDDAAAYGVHQSQRSKPGNCRAVATRGPNRPPHTTRIGAMGGGTLGVLE